jgi:uncharacterized membrane protein
MKTQSSVRIGLFIVGCCAIIFAIYGALEATGRGFLGQDTGRFIASFACFGILFGGVLAFDPLPGEKGTDRPFWRIGLGALSGALLGVLWQWPGEGIALSGIVGAALGYAGTTWAKYV